MQLPKFHLFNNNSNNLDIILHGGSKGIDSPFIQKLFQASVQEGNNAVAFNFPYLDRGEDHSSGPELLEELDTLESVLEFCRNLKAVKKVRFLAKSLGGIVASYFLNKIANLAEFEYSIVIFGCIIEDVDLLKFPGSITIVQGEKDKYGSMKDIKNKFRKAISPKIKYFSIPKADHSYRIPDTEKAVFEDEAVRKVFPDCEGGEIQ